MNGRINRGALITGGGRRIGAAIARTLANEGWFVYIHCNKSLVQAAKVLDEIRIHNGNGMILIEDLSTNGSAERLIEKTKDGPAPLVALVNNASMFEYDSIETITESKLDEHFAINVRAPILLSKAFAAALKDHLSGCIINLLDNKIFAINPDYLSYTISKVALQGATSALAMALGPKVRVNGIAPGITLESGNQGEESFYRGQTMSPLGRVSTINDITGAVTFILNTGSLNGHIITIDGGQHLQQLKRDVSFINK
jgi:NAD(P)-dependent dehydrogenase (short-subunit alcohol dehydrogenase family)